MAFDGPIIWRPSQRVTLPPNGAIYPLERYTGEQATNYIYPDNFRLPTLCQTCPLREFMQPQIAHAAIKHFSIPDIYSTNMGGNNVLLLHDAANEDGRHEPVVLDELPIVSPYSAQHEMPVSQVLGRMHHKVDRCSGPQARRRLLGIKATIYCGALQTVRRFNKDMARNGIGREITYDNAELLRPTNTVVTAELHAWRTS